MIKRNKKNLALLVLFTGTMCVSGILLTISAIRFKMFVGATLVVVCTIVMLMAFYTYAEILIQLMLKEKRT